jgi:tetratricopeptide (TPR) repeat protein
MTSEPEEQPVLKTGPDESEANMGIPPSEAPPSRRVLKWVIAAGIVALVAYPLIRRLQSDGPNASAASASGAGDAQLNRSLQAYQAGKYQEAILEAQAALKEKPNFAAAYNNLAVSYLQLKMYDDAIKNAQEAIRVQPDFQLAKNNLAWIQQEKAKASGPITTLMSQCRTIRPGNFKSRSTPRRRR